MDRHRFGGSYDTVVRDLLDYTELGFEIFGLRGYDLLPDAQEVGRHVIPQVKAAVAHREAGRIPDRIRARQAARRQQLLNLSRRQHRSPH